MLNVDAGTSDFLIPLGLRERELYEQLVPEDHTDMPLFLEPGQAVMVPLEATYNAACTEVPRRWRRVLETPTA